MLFYYILYLHHVGRKTEKYSPEALSCRLQDNIDVYLRGIVHAGENWSHRDINRDKHRTFIEAAMNSVFHKSHGICPVAERLLSSRQALLLALRYLFVLRRHVQCTGNDTV